MKDKNYNIKAFLFDLGNVILPFDLSIAAKKIKQHTGKPIKEIYDIFLNSRLTGEFEEGKIEPLDFFYKIKGALSLDDGLTYEGFKSILNDIFKEDRRVSHLIRKLTKKYKVAIVSNINQIHYEYIKKNFNIMNQVHKVILSYEVGIRKPHPKIYKLAFRLVESDPRDIIYIDDRLDLIRGAFNLGLNCILYEGYSKLIEALAKFGITY